MASTMLTAPPELGSAKPRTSFLELPAETRLQIYGYIFAPEKPRCCTEKSTFLNSHCCSFSRRHDGEKSEAPSTCSPVSTGILATSKLIYLEALPVLWESVELRVNLPTLYAPRNQSDPAPLDRSMGLKEHMPHFVRRTAITAGLAVDDLDSDTRGAQSMLRARCEQVRATLPRLRELRVHLDTFGLWSVPTHARHLVGVLEPALGLLEGITLYVDTHAYKSMSELYGSELQHEVVEQLRAKAQGSELNVSVECWNPKDFSPSTPCEEGAYGCWPW